MIPSTAILNISQTLAISTGENRGVLLAMCLVLVHFNWRFTIARAILDTSAQASFISEHRVQQLRCPHVCSTLVVDGIGTGEILSHGVCHLAIQTL